MIPPNSSLVKYESPQAVVKNMDKKNSKPKNIRMSSLPQIDDNSLPLINSPPQSARNKREANNNAPQQTDEILNLILPPREWMDNGQLYVQQVSSTPATRLDVVVLQEDLDKILQQRQARETGICPVRRELYSQCFDELIRQVTINCSERGLILLRVRDEIRMTMAAYQALYESSIAFGMRKALQAEQGKIDMQQQIKDLLAEKAELERQVTEQKARCEQTEKRSFEQRQLDERKHTEEVQFLKKINQQYKAQLEAILVPKK